MILRCATARRSGRIDCAPNLSAKGTLVAGRKQAVIRPITRRGSPSGFPRPLIFRLPSTVFPKTQKQGNAQAVFPVSRIARFTAAATARMACHSCDIIIKQLYLIAATLHTFEVKAKIENYRYKLTEIQGHIDSPRELINGRMILRCILQSVERTGRAHSARRPLYA